MSTRTSDRLPPSSVFRKSSYSGTSGNCVEVAITPEGSAVRDTRNREVEHLAFDRSEWCVLLLAVSH
ncbi:DUF397 domain-containing protein [Nocardiopsis sp. NPDC006139]|uniref:DUF397 domain-containing protein n=1 Tax=Nocardiopsis sp. NPDC006139 TaxID=3154578 RepID=UPI0033A42A6A